MNNNVYCWFDWDDNTTTVNTINIIKEPRKPWMEYKPGERVLAKLPQFGLWHGVIVEISDSKKDLVQKMTERQKNAAARESKSGMQKKTRPKVAPVDTQNYDDMDTADKGKKKETVANKKRVRDDEDKTEEKKKKKIEEAMKMDAKNRQLEEMIMERRKAYTSREDTNVDDSQDTDTEQNTDITPLHSDIGPVENSPQTIRTSEPFWPRPQFGSPDSAFQRYRYYGDLMSPSGYSAATYQTLNSSTELQERCARLELENEELKRENLELKSQLERQGVSIQTDDVIATPRKVEFLRQLVTSFEKKTQKKRGEQARSQLFPPAPVELYEGTNLTSEEENRNSQQETSHWEQSVTSSGVKKVRLVPELEVYLTQGQLSFVKHTGSGNPRRMTIALLDALFSKEQLAASSAKGSKKAYNATMQTVPLPGVTVQAIKLFVLNAFKKESGEPCLTDPVFNDIINSKCATSRRSLKR